MDKQSQGPAEAPLKPRVIPMTISDGHRRYRAVAQWVGKSIDHIEVEGLTYFRIGPLVGDERVLLWGPSRGGGARIGTLTHLGGGYYRGEPTEVYRAGFRVAGANEVEAAIRLIGRLWSKGYLIKGGRP